MLWKKDKTKARPDETALEGMVASHESVFVKALVNTEDCYREFWKLIGFLESLKSVRFPEDEFHTSRVELERALEGHDKEAVLAAVKGYLGGSLSDRDIEMLVDRKETLGTFKLMMEDSEFFKSEMSRLEKRRPEDLWQAFFEDNTWIFGYGLVLVSCESFSENRLEQITTGANVFSGAGKRIDAVMRTRGFIQSLLFTEIKRHDTELLMRDPYRQPDVYQVSRELSGAVSQVQKTSYKAIQGLGALHRQRTPSGDPEFEVATIKPRQVVIVGNLEELSGPGGTNLEKLSSFELYRRSQHDVEILTFDELLARAEYIVESSAVMRTTAGVHS